MDIRLLEDALALLEERNLSKAAARRNVTQPAFSRRIRTLEEWVGAPLLDRQANRVVLHSRLLENEDEIRSLLGRLSRLRDLITSDRRTARAVILATQHALATEVFLDVQRRCSAGQPQLTWRLRALNREDCIAMFFRGDADLLLCYEAHGFPPLPFDASIEKRLWMHDRLIPVVGGALRDRLSKADGLPPGVPTIAYPRESHFGRLLQETAANEPLKRLGASSVVVSDFTLGILELARAGTGVGWVPQSMCLKDLRAGALVSLEDSCGSVPLDVSLFAAAQNGLALEMIRAS